MHTTPLASLSTLFLLYSLFSLASPAFALPHTHSHSVSRSLPSNWFQEDPSHPVHKLFRKADPFPQVGSPTWSSAYPTRTPDLNNLPAAWTEALKAAVSAGKIPNIPVPTLSNDSPQYPQGVDPYSPQVCSAFAKCKAPGVVWDAPASQIGIGFDDGPVFGASDTLYNFLKEQNQTATHFMIGVAILQAPQLFLQAFNQGGDIAVHTYTHPHMSTLSNEAVLAELGWTMQIIHDSTGGRIPKFWRPPYGDMDNRVQAISQEVFGLTAIIWNRDSEDWSIASNGTTAKNVMANLHTWITGPKSPGLVILEHELTPTTVQLFMDAYPLMKSNNWLTPSIARISPSVVDNETGALYWNAPNGNTGDVEEADDVVHFGAFGNVTEIVPTTTSGPATTSVGKAGPNTSATQSATPSQSQGNSLANSNDSSKLSRCSSTYTLGFLGLLIWFIS